MFNLDEAIGNWKKGLAASQVLEDGYITELESHLRDAVGDLIRKGMSGEEAFRELTEALGDSGKIDAEFYKVYTTRRSGRPFWQPPRYVPALVWNCAKVALRKIKRQKAYSFINIAGLAVGLTCSLFILLYVRFELGFDAYHKDVDRVYLVGLQSRSEKGRSLSSGNMPLVAPTLKARFPQVEYASRMIQNWGDSDTVKRGDVLFNEENGLWHADQDIFQILTIPFVAGNSGRALERPNTAVITERMAGKYFGAENPMGRTLSIMEKDYEITGIVRDPPPNTDFAYEFIMSWKTLENDELLQGWRPGITASACLIKLQAGTDAGIFEGLIRNIAHEYCGEELNKMGVAYEEFLLPVRGFHRVSLTGGMIRPSSSVIYIYIFSAVGVLILLVACMNFMNLATARSAHRAGEVGMRKVVGAQRRQLVAQFLGESLFITFLAGIIAVILVLAARPFFNGLAGTNFAPVVLGQPGILVGIAALLLIVGLIAGSYPAAVLSGFKPIAVLKGTLRSGLHGATMRRLLVVGQFSISIALVIATFVVQRQILFMKNQPLGFDHEQKLVINLKKFRMITDKYEMLKSEFLRHPSILNASASSGVPGFQVNQTWVYPTGEENMKGQAFRSLRCDHDFLGVYGVKLAAGRMFDKRITSDTLKAYIINEAGVHAFGWGSPEEAVGKTLYEEAYHIVGVVKDFHWWGLQRPIEPLLIRVVPELFRTITLTVDTSNLKDTIAFIGKKYNELFPGDLFEFFFVDANFDKQYRTEERIGHIFRVFTSLGILIACLGLFGLVSFVAEQRTKEIGIRKILGASVPGLIALLTREIVKWVLAANLIAWPVAYLAGRKWLQGFAYRMDLGAGIFFVSGVLALGIALLTVGCQAWKAAAANPVKSLRYE